MDEPEAPGGPLKDGKRRRLRNRLEKKHQSGSATKAEEKLRRQMGKAMALLSGNPRHPGLHSHEITSLTAWYGRKVWEFYLENDTPKAGRIFWCYGPDQGSITIIGLEPHPDDKANSYKRLHCQPWEKRYRDIDVSQHTRTVMGY